MDYYFFCQKWLTRAEANRKLDDGDRFIALWIAFNGWLKSKYGEDKRDYQLIADLSQDSGVEIVFQNMRETSREFKLLLEGFEHCTILDMRIPGDRSKAKKYTKDFPSFLQTIYQIRCNLFHGRKDVDEDKNDQYLVALAYRLLTPFFKKVLAS